VFSKEKKLMYKETEWNYHIEWFCKAVWWKEKTITYDWTCIEQTSYCSDTGQAVFLDSHLSVITLSD
jgi:hypothetical protein